MFATFVMMAMAVATPAHESTSQPFVPHVPGLKSQLCVERLEDQGAMNAHPGRVNIYEEEDLSMPDQSFSLAGGQNACVALRPGRYVIVVSSRRFDGPVSDSPKLPDSDECHSSPYRTQLRPGERVILDERPSRSLDGGYSDCGWKLVPRGTPHPGHR